MRRLELLTHDTEPEDAVAVTDDRLLERLALALAVEAGAPSTEEVATVRLSADSQRAVRNSWLGRRSARPESRTPRSSPARHEVLPRHKRIAFER